LNTGVVIALLGAESTGKTTLAHQLAAALMPQRHAVVVAEYLREFCDHHGRTPMASEQSNIADEQTRRIAAAAKTADVVIADTTALMTAVYSELIFGQIHLHAQTMATHAASVSLTLVSALDVPWQADGLQRDGKHSREPTDNALRAALSQARIDYTVVSGLGPTRLAKALSCVERALAAPVLNFAAKSPKPCWHWHCERCSDADCERRSLFGFVKP
jgi:nicotinamide riboside kinase